MKVLLLDNYDSFTYNLAHLFGALGTEVVVTRNDEIDADEAERLAPSQLVVSPGPGKPRDAGASEEIIRRLAPTTPTLGVCLGHQAIVEVFGGEVGYARELLHGKASPVRHDGTGLFTDVPQPFDAGGLGVNNQSLTGVFLGAEITTPRAQAMIGALVISLSVLTFHVSRPRSSS